MPPFLCVHFRLVCPSKDIIDRNIVIIRKSDEGLGGDVALLVFVVAVGVLCNEEGISNLFLRERKVFSYL